MEVYDADGGIAKEAYHQLQNEKEALEIQKDQVRNSSINQLTWLCRRTELILHCNFAAASREKRSSNKVGQEIVAVGSHWKTICRWTWGYEKQGMCSAKWRQN